MTKDVNKGVEALLRSVQKDEFACPYCQDRAQRKPLTDEEIAEIMVQIWSNNNIPVRERSHRLARAIEAAHGIKE